jgi:hypothetical protein
VAKGVLVWEERLSPMNEVQLKREYLGLGKFSIFYG